MQILVSVIDDERAHERDTSGTATDSEMAAIDAFNDRLRADGNWVFAGGLASPSAATVIDNRDAAPITTDGPFLESKEYVAGFWIMQVRDRAEALALTADASKACHRKLELREIV